MLLGILLVLADPSELVISPQQAGSRQIEARDYADAQLVSPMSMITWPNGKISRRIG
jgi:hypothetical protein